MRYRLFFIIAILIILAMFMQSCSILSNINLSDLINEIMMQSIEQSSENESKENSLSNEGSKQETSIEENSTLEESSIEVSTEESSIPEESSEESSEEEQFEPESSEQELSQESVISEESKEPNNLGIEIPQGLRVSYIVYDVTSDSIISSLNTNDDYRTGCTIKAAYVLWLLKNHSDLANEWETKMLTYYRTEEGTSVWRDLGVKDGTKFNLLQALEYCIKYSDNDAYIMLTTEYEYEGFNSYMEKLGVSIRLGSYQTGYNFTSATAEEQLILWKEIMNFCFNNNSEEAQKFKVWLEDAYYDFVEKVVGKPGMHMSGWSPNTGTINDCAIILDEEGKPKTIFILLTSNGIKMEKMDLSEFYSLVSQIWEQIKK